MIVDIHFDINFDMYFDINFGMKFDMHFVMNFACVCFTSPLAQIERRKSIPKQIPEIIT